MKRGILIPMALIVFFSIGNCKEIRIPTCKEAAVSMSDHGESGDYL